MSGDRQLLLHISALVLYLCKELGLGLGGAGQLDIPPEQVAVMIDRALQAFVLAVKEGDDPFSEPRVKVRRRARG